jgi:hypothetical protein
MAIDLKTITRFDAALAQYMAITFDGGDSSTWPMLNHWRTKCHSGAKIAAFALRLLFPLEAPMLLRVEMKAKMAGSVRFVHTGWADDPNRFQGSYPMHWAVRVGKGLYDPTFWQLRVTRTPLELPDEPFFFAPEFFKFASDPQYVDTEGFLWAQMQRPGSNQTLWVAYMMQPRPLPPEEEAILMSDGQARRHAERVVALFRKAKKR